MATLGNTVPVWAGAVLKDNERDKVWAPCRADDEALRNRIGKDVLRRGPDGQKVHFVPVGNFAVKLPLKISELDKQGMEYIDAVVDLISKYDIMYTDPDEIQADTRNEKASAAAVWCIVNYNDVWFGETRATCATYRVGIQTTQPAPDVVAFLMRSIKETRSACAAELLAYVDYRRGLKP